MKNIIVIEGVDGCGKTTFVSEVVECLIKRGYSVDKRREIGGTPIGEHIRNLVLFPAYNQTLSPQGQALMIYAARVELLNHIRKYPDKLFILDRHFVSTRIYQGDDHRTSVLIANLEAMLLEKDDYLLHVLLTGGDIERVGVGDVDDAIQAKFVERGPELAEKYRKHFSELSPKLEAVNTFGALGDSVSNFVDALVKIEGMERFKK